MTVGLMEWMEMDARALHSTEWTKWTVDVEWIASLYISSHDAPRSYSSSLPFSPFTDYSVNKTLIAFACQGPSYKSRVKGSRCTTANRYRRVRW